MSSVAHHNPHINAIFVYFFMQELFVNKTHFFKFLYMNDKPRLHQLKIITSSRSTVQASLTAWMFSSVWGDAIKEGETPYVENKYKASPTYKKRKNFLFHRLACISQIFVLSLPKWSTLSISKLRYSSYLKSTNRVTSIPFVGNPHFSILLHRVRYLKNLFMYRR